MRRLISKWQKVQFSARNCGGRSFTKITDVHRAPHCVDCKAISMRVSELCRDGGADERERRTEARKNVSASDACRPPALTYMTFLLTCVSKRPLSPLALARASALSAPRAAEKRFPRGSSNSYSIGDVTFIFENRLKFEQFIGGRRPKDPPARAASFQWPRIGAGGLRKLDTTRTNFLIF